MSSHVADRTLTMPHHATRGRGRVAAPAALGIAVAFAALAFVGYRNSSPSNMNGLGLLHALPTASLVGLGGLVAAFVFSLSSGNVSPRWSYAQLCLLVSALALAPTVMEPNPRFATAWQHAGFADYIARNHHILAHTDARFSWPSFFAAAGLFSKSVGLQPLDLLRFTPLVLDLAYLVPFSVIAGYFLPRPRQRIVAAFLFAVGNWVGQDYFSPQGFNFLLYLVAVALLLRFLCWGEVSPRWKRLGQRLVRLEEGSLEAAATPPESRPATGLLAVIAVYAAATVSHQLTPYFILFATTALVILGVCKAKWLPLLMLCITLAYFVWGAQDFWSGHLSELLRAIGSLGASFNENLVARTGPSDPAHQVVIVTRLALPVLYALLALAGLVRSRSIRLLAPAVLAVVPMLVLGLQSYGGEAILRCFLFGLPFFSILATHVFTRAFPRKDSTRSVAWLRMFGRIVLATGLVVAVVVARYGNEAFEQMRPADVRTVQMAYQIAPPGSTLFTLTESVPWRSRSVEKYDYAYASPIPLDSKDLPMLLAEMGSVKHRAYLILTDSQWAELRYYHGLSADRLAYVKRLIIGSPAIMPVYQEGDVGVFELAREGK